MTSLSRRSAIAFVVLIVIIGLSLSLTRTPKNVPTEAYAPLDSLPVEPPPPLTEHMKDVVAASKGFSVMISYTDNGFEPANATIAKGQSVRFVNNSTHTMWIMSKGGVSGVYPAAGETCGQSAFDTCVALPPHEIWEFTFDVAGTWAYQNNAQKSDEGTIHVQ